MAAAAKAERGKTKVRSKGHVKSTVKVSKPKSLCVAALSASDSQPSPNKPWRPALSLLVVLISLLVLLIWFAMWSRFPPLRNGRATLWPSRAIWPSAMRTARTMPPVIRSRSCAGKGTIRTVRPVRGTMRVAAGFLTGKGTTRTTGPMPNSFLVRSVLLPV